MAFSDFVGTDRKEKMMNELYEDATPPDYTNEWVGQNLNDQTQRQG